MTPTTFPEANASYGPPPDLTEAQCMTIPAYHGEAKSGSVDGVRIVVVAWQPSAEELQQLAAGKPIFISMIGGLAPHFLTTDFQQAIHPA
jgi:hypothetical protein